MMINETWAGLCSWSTSRTPAGFQTRAGLAQGPVRQGHSPFGSPALNSHRHKVALWPSADLKASMGGKTASQGTHTDHTVTSVSPPAAWAVHTHNAQQSFRLHFQKKVGGGVLQNGNDLPPPNTQTFGLPVESDRIKVQIWPTRGFSNRFFKSVCFYLLFSIFSPEW